MFVPLGQIINGAKSPNILGITSRDVIIDYINRARELAIWKANWNTQLGTIDICSNNCGYVTLPYFVGTVLAANVGGVPSYMRSSWYEFNLGGTGSCRGDGLGGSGVAWPSCGMYVDDCLWTPVFQDLKDWSYVAAICEDPIDGNGSLQMIVEGETMDANYNQKQALTIPTTGPSLPGVRLTLLTNYAATDSAITPFKKITQVTKPVTRGYVKLIAFPSQQMANAVTIGYYAPHETNPMYRRIRIGAKCQWVRCRYRRAETPLFYDYEDSGFGSYEAILQLLRAIRLRETNNEAEAQVAEDKGIEILTDLQTSTDGPGFGSPNIDPDFGVGTICYY